MKNVFYLLTILTFALVITSCDKDDHSTNDRSENDHNNSNLHTRAASLGFTKVEAYQESVSEQCAAGNHENCDTLSDGSHTACVNADHSGTNHDGTTHNGTGHGTHNGQNQVDQDQVTEDKNHSSTDGQNHNNTEKH